MPAPPRRRSRARPARPHSDPAGASRGRRRPPRTGAVLQPPALSHSVASSWKRSATATWRARASPSASRSTAAIGSSATSSGRSSSPTENLTNGSSSFQRRSLRYERRKPSLMGGAKCAQQISASAGSRMSVMRRAARRRPSRTRSHDVTPSRSARSRGSSPSSESQASTSAGAHADARGAEDMARESTRGAGNGPATGRCGVPGYSRRRRSRGQVARRRHRVQRPPSGAPCGRRSRRT